jgi:predicted transcriptional regulator
MNSPLTDEEKARIREMLDDGQSHNSIAKQVGRAQSTISEYARREGYSPLPDRTPRVANQARRDYAKAERLELLNQAFETGAEMLERGGLSARDYKEVMTAIAITVDKRRLEEGMPDSVRETRRGGPHGKLLDLEKEFAKIEEDLAAEAEQRRRDEELLAEQHRQTLDSEAE